LGLRNIHVKANVYFADSKQLVVSKIIDVDGESTFGSGTGTTELKIIFREASSDHKDRKFYLTFSVPELKTCSPVVTSVFTVLEKVKIVVVGMAGVGKTKFVQSFLNASSSKNDQQQSQDRDILESYHCLLPIGEQLIAVNLWDTAGEAMAEQIKRDVVYPGTQIFLFCFAIDDRKSFMAVTDIVKQLRDKYPNALFGIIGTKAELRNAKRNNVKRELLLPVEGDVKKEETHAAFYMECSSEEHTSCANVFQETVKEVLLKKQKDLASRQQLFCSRGSCNCIIS